MPLLCDALPHETVVALNRLIGKLPPQSLLRRECMDGDVRVFKQHDVLILHSAAGFYFEHMDQPDLETALKRHIRSTRAYHCSAFEIDADDPTVVEKLLVRFQEQHGEKMARQIDWCTITFNGKNLMLVKFPPCILRHLLAPTGGLMKTGFRGPSETLALVPTLVRFGALKDPFILDGRVSSIFATEYKEHQYETVKRIHWDIVREVIARPHSGIYLGPVAEWDA
jgi:hypothetical protein